MRSEKERMCEHILEDNASIRCRPLPHEKDCLAGRMNQSVQRWNEWSERSLRSDVEYYTHRNIKFALEYVCRRGLGGSQLIIRENILRDPIECGIEETSAVHCIGEIGRNLPNHGSKTLGVISRWNKQLVLVDNIHFMNEVEQVISTRWTMRPRLSQGAIETCPHIMGESLLNSAVKRVCIFRKRKLNCRFLPISETFLGNREEPLPFGTTNDFPKGVVESGAKIVNDVPDDQRHSVYEGFVLFGKSGTVAGFCICFNDVTERSRFAEQFIKLLDMFRGPINLKKCAVCHG